MTISIATITTIPPQPSSSCITTITTPLIRNVNII